jgi:hypothetical protein
MVRTEEVSNVLRYGTFFILCRGEKVFSPKDTNPVQKKEGCRRSSLENINQIDRNER